MSTETRVCIVGAGAAGLILAHVLLQDGFRDVQLLTRDKTAGGIWARDRVYPELYLNNVHGEFRFTPLPMAAPPNADKTGGRLSGQDMQAYMESFADTLLKGRIRYGTEVRQIQRDEVGTWRVHVTDVESGREETLKYDKVVVCTGGCSKPFIPSYLAPEKAKAGGFTGPVFHSSEFAARLPSVLAATQPISDPKSTSTLSTGSDAGTVPPVVVIGGGKSAQDISSYFARQNRAVTLIYSDTDAALATTSPLPNFIRKSRFLNMLSPHITLQTRLERFLHTTRLGSTIVRFIWRQLSAGAVSALAIPSSSPLLHKTDLFWGVRTNDEGVARPSGFHAMVNAGRINVIAPARVVGYDEGRGVVLESGEKVEASAVVLCTGYENSWAELFDEKTATSLGILPISPTTPPPSWSYTTLSSPPPLHPRNKETEGFYPIYRGMVPARNVKERDFAIGGAAFTINKGYTFEVQANWISGYLLGELNLRLPGMGDGAKGDEGEPSVEKTMKACAREAAWMRRRWPGVWMGGNASHNSVTAFWNWMQSVDDLLKDLGVRSHRSGMWPLNQIDVMEIKGLGEERRALREEGKKN